MKQQFKSRTMLVMLLAEFLAAGTVAMNYLQPFLTDSQYAFIMAALSIITPMVAMFMRQITTEAIGDK